jgi:hypothetical protein
MNEFAGSNLEWTNQTVLHPVALVMMVLLGLAMLIVPRRWAVIPMLVMACFISPAQRIVIFSLDFNLLRVMIVFGWVRLFLYGEFTDLKLKVIDWAMIACAIVSTIAYTFLNDDSFFAFVNRLGDDFDALGMYFLFRCLVRNWDDLYRITLGFIVLSVPVMFCFIVEASTGRNLFGFLGGVPEITLIREGRLRCQGAFAHPIMAGCFWAAVMPLMAGLGFRGGKMRVASIVGLIASSIIVILCASSTPLLAILAGLIGAACFFIRYHMRLVRWGALAMVIALHLFMHGPVWHLIAQIDVLGGSTGWHRFNLINQTIEHFDEWWLVGTLNTPKWGQGLGDITNQYVLEAITGGLLTLIIFILIISLAFAGVGRLWRVVHADRQRMIMAWSLGVTMFVHVANFMAVSYFGQIIMVWYLTLAAIASLDGLAQRAIEKSLPRVKSARRLSPRLRAEIAQLT